MSAAGFTGTRITALSDLGVIRRPEFFGTVDGSAANDTAACQAAIDACESAGGGTVRCSHSYQIQKQATSTFGFYQNVWYGLWINGSNIRMDGGGTLVLDAVPLNAGDPDGLGWLLIFGNGLFDVDNVPPDAELRPQRTGGTFENPTLVYYPSNAWLRENGTYIEDVILEDISFDCSVATDGQLQTMQSGIWGGVVCFSGVKNGLMSNLIVDHGWYHPVNHNAICQDCVFEDIAINDIPQIAFWMDGGIRCEYRNLSATAFLNAASGGHSACVLGPNTDYDQIPEDCLLEDCTFVDGTIAIHGHGNLIQNISTVLAQGNGSNFAAIVCAAVNNENGTYDCYDNQFINCTLDSNPAGATEGIGFRVSGDTFNTNIDLYNANASTYNNTFINGTFSVKLLAATQAQNYSTGNEAKLSLNTFNTVFKFSNQCTLGGCANIFGSG